LLRSIFSVGGLLIASLMIAQPGSRKIFKIKDGWHFAKEIKEDNSLQWEKVTIPHTWNVEDVMDDTPGYYRGVGLYKRSLKIDKKFPGKQLYLFFEAANQTTQVYINGKKAGEHIGGYSGFYIPITTLLDIEGENEILVKVDNSYDQNIAPLSADFTFYGGIYRDVFLVAVEPVHFSLNDHAGDGVYISTPSVNNSSAIVNIKAIVSNDDKNKKEISIRSVIKTKTGKIVATGLTKTTIEPGGDKTILQAPIKIVQPILWSPESPYLYTVTTEIIDKAGKIIDVINSPWGFRWFEFDGEKGFSLNGKPYKLVGTSRHQDYKSMGNAVPDKLAIKDIELLKKMGGNFLRVAHYPQDPAVLKACDSIGLLASVEIPIVNEITESDSFYLNSRNMQVEMIRQNYNHPSVIIWCYMNEVLLRPHYNDDKTKQKKYFEAITSLARSLESITRKEDPYRYTMIAHHGDYNKYNNAGLNDISMIVGWNLYSGWYGAKLSDFPAFLDSFHKRHPQMPMVVSEYGADADPRINSLDPVRFDKSVEYTTSFHQYYLKEMLSRPFVSGAMIWNLADFNSETRNESMPHINNKGLLEWDRTPKDPYYYYKAILSKKPFVKILGQHKKAGVADSKGAYCIRVIQVASNLNDLTLRINGKSMGKQTSRNGLCEWMVPLLNGVNNIEVKTTEGKVVSDKLALEFDLLPNKFADTAVQFHQLNILLGSKRSFIDEKKQVWIPDQKYEQGSWGYIDGRNFKAPGNSRLPYGTDKNISGSADDPIYQTQQIGLSKYKLDVPAGEYEVTLHFAELLGGQVKGSAYNLADPDRIEPNGKRIFDILINNKLVLDKFNIADDYGAATAVSKKIKIIVADNNGMEIDFKAIEGEPVLNALQIKKIETNHHQAEVTTNK